MRKKRRYPFILIFIIALCQCHTPQNIFASASVQFDYPGFTSGASVQSGAAIEMDTKTAGVISPADPTPTYTFVAPASGRYTFFSSGDIGLKAVLYGADGVPVAQAVPAQGENNFKLDAELAADMAVQIEISHVKANKYGSFYITVSQAMTNAMPKAVLLFTGYYDKVGISKYPEYTNDDIAKLLDKARGVNTKEFIITTANHSFNTYQTSDGTRQIVEKIDIQSLDKSLTGHANDEGFALIQEQYSVILTGRYLSGRLYSGDDIARSLYGAQNPAAALEAEKTSGVALSNIGPLSPYLTLDSFAADSVRLAKRLIGQDPNVKLWFAFPPMAFPTLADSYTAPYKRNIADAVKLKLGGEQWDRNVEGFYFGTECIPAWYTSFDPANPDCFGNPVVKNMKALSQHVRGMGKKFMWIPYYGPHIPGRNTDDDEKIGYIANKTNIFDYIVIQPTYYFDEAQIGNIASVAGVLSDSAVKDHKGGVVGGAKLFGAKLGAEMELDARVINRAPFMARYAEYETVYAPFAPTCPAVFYAGGRDDLMQDGVIAVIRRFFKY